MPRGSEPGERRGGRNKGTPNKAMAVKREQEREAQQIASEIGTDPVALQAALERARARKIRGLDEMMELAKVLKNDVIAFRAAAVATGMPGARDEDGREIRNTALWNEYKAWAEFYFDLAAEITQYQEPKLKATASMQIPGVGGAPAKVIDGEAKLVRTGDPVAAARAYQRFMQAPREVPVLPPMTKKSP